MESFRYEEESKINIDYLDDLIEKELSVSTHRWVKKSFMGPIPSITIIIGNSGDEIVINDHEIIFDIWGKKYPKVFIVNMTHNEVIEVLRKVIMAEKEDTEMGGIHDLVGADPYKVDLTDISLNEE
jgi:mRNA-degrading endonuclease HigB of HigAB toxin-antitoxin module